MVFFDTASLPDNVVVTSANLSLYCVGKHADTSFNITVQTGVTSTYPNNPLFASDYNYAHYTGNGGSANVTAFTENAYNNITLNPTGLTWVNAMGYTKLVLRSSRDIGNVAPSNPEFANFSAREVGVNFTVLHLAYIYGDTVYYFYGGYSEAGVPTNQNLTVNAFTTDTTVSFTLNGSYVLGVENPVTYFTWNLTSGTTNITRTYYVHNTDGNTFYLFIPSEPINLYLFDLVDLYGVSNGYVESSGNVNGTERVFERQPASTANSVPFYMGWASKYNIRVRCDQGTFLWGTFTALAVQTQIILIPSGVFPTAYYGLNTTVTAARLNDTWLQVNYSDPTETTDWLNVTFYYKSGYTMANAYSVNSTGVVQTVNWYGATATTDYLAKARASKNGTLHTWSFSLPQNRTATHVWDGLFDSIGTLPFSPANLIGLFIVLCVFGVFSWLYLPIGLLLGVFTAGFLTYISWLDLSWTAISFALAIVFIVFIQKGKERERTI